MTKVSKEYAQELIKDLQSYLDDYECGYKLIPSGYPYAEDGFIRVIRNWSEKLIDSVVESCEE